MLGNILYLTTLIKGEGSNSIDKRFKLRFYIISYKQYMSFIEQLLLSLVICMSYYNFMNIQL